MFALCRIERIFFFGGFLFFIYLAFLLVPNLKFLNIFISKTIEISLFYSPVFVIHFLSTLLVIVTQFVSYQHTNTNYNNDNKYFVELKRRQNLILNDKSV